MNRREHVLAWYGRGDAARRDRGRVAEGVGGARDEAIRRLDGSAETAATRYDACLVGVGRCPSVFVEVSRMRVRPRAQLCVLHTGRRPQTEAVLYEPDAFRVGRGRLTHAGLHSSRRA